MNARTVVSFVCVALLVASATAATSRTKAPHARPSADETLDTRTPVFPRHHLGRPREGYLNAALAGPLREAERDAREATMPGPSTLWFDQRVDHFKEQDTRTWKQRYFVNANYWEKGGPVFLMVGGEGEISSGYVTRVQMAEYGMQYGALLVALEHRFYGESQPFDDWSTANLAYLSSEQALADLAHFRTSLTKEYGIPDATWIVFGGSYPGCLSGWFRLKYPHLVHASVASSGPVYPQLDFYQYLQVVNASLSTYSADCVTRVRAGVAQVQAMLQTADGRAKLAHDFQTCHEPQTEKDIATFMSFVAGNFMGVVQYNNEGQALNIPDVCGMMEEKDDPLAGLIEVNNHFVPPGSCLTVLYNETVAELQATDIVASAGMRQWTYQTCIEFGFYQTTDAPADTQPFGDLIPLEYYTDMCKDVYGFDFLPNTNWTLTNYGGRRPQGSNIAWVNGNIDPWHALSILEPIPGNPTEVPVFIEGGAHCSNMSPYRPTDSPSLVQARKTIAAMIGGWLKEAAVAKQGLHVQE